MLKILIVDDEQPLTELIAAFLSRVLPDAQFLVATELQDGLELAERDTPDAILLDLKLGHVTPEETIQNIPVFDKFAATLILTGTVAMDSYMVKCHDAGAMTFLTKKEWISSGRAGYLSHAILTAIFNWKRIHNV